MPIKRLTALSVLAAALFVMSPVQATTSKSHGKTAHAKHTSHAVHTASKTSPHKQTHAKSNRHGKLATTTRKTSSKLASRGHHTKGKTKSLVAASAASSKASLPLTHVSLPSVPAMSGAQVIAEATPQLLRQLPVFNPALMLTQTFVPAVSAAPTTDNAAIASQNTAAGSDAQADVAVQMPATDDAGSVTDLRKSLIAMAMKLRDIRYARGGHDPSTGFDCSGFVRYVFANAIGMQLPNNSASQFLAGLKVNRSDMKAGDLVFFRTHGKRSISHVGIYISNGRFIHSPTSGKSVEISSLSEGYWAKRFAGAKRPEAIAQVADKG